MAELLKNPAFSAFAAPLLAVAFAVFVKWSSQNDRHAKFRKEDIAVGQELAVSSVFALVLAMPLLRNTVPVSEPAAAAAGEPVMETALLALMFLSALWIISTIVRKAGWDADGRLKLWIGLVLPLIYGFATTGIAAAWISSHA